MEFFENQGDNSKQNEALLEAIMEQQKKREKKHDVQKGYLLNKKTEKVSNPFERKKLTDEEPEPTGEEREFKHKPIDNSEPAFIIGSKYSPKKQLSQKAKLTIALSVILGIVLIATTFCLVFFLTKHKIDVVCSSRNGITIIDDRGEELNEISLRMYESLTFKVEVKPNYSDSVVEVWFNNKLLTGTSSQDKYGYYTIKYTGEGNELRIVGVVENDYDVTFDNSSNYDYKVTRPDGTEILADGQKLTYFYGNKISFILYDSTKGVTMPQYLACVYDNGVLLTPNQNGVYELTYNKNHNIVSYNHSPFDWFETKITYKTDNANEVEKCEVVGLSSLGEQQKVIKLPQKQNNIQLTYKFATNKFYSAVTELIVSNGTNFTERLFDSFTDLQTITVADPSAENNTYYSENGMLYYREAHEIISGLERSTIVTNNLVKVPMGYGKNLAVGARIMTINTDTICSGAIYRLNYIKTVSLGPKVQTIQPLALCNTYGEGTFTVTLATDNENIEIENGIIYNKQKTVIINAQLAKGDVTIANGVAITDSAFSYSEVTSVTFEGTSVLGGMIFAITPSLQKVVFNTNLGTLPKDILFGSAIKTIDLRNVTGVITIDDLAVLTWNSEIKIVVSDENLEAYKTTYATKTFANLFVGATEFDAA